MSFPAGKALDELSRQADPVQPYRVKCEDLTFSLSGMENQVKAMAAEKRAPAEIARFALETVSDVVRRVTVEAQNRYPGLAVLCSGGVASNTRLRYMLTEFCQARFAQPQYATDNAMGTAILAHRLLKRGGSAL